MIKLELVANTSGSLEDALFDLTVTFSPLVFVLNSAKTCVQGGALTQLVVVAEAKAEASHLAEFGLFNEIRVEFSFHEANRSVHRAIA